MSWIQITILVSFVLFVGLALSAAVAAQKKRRAAIDALFADLGLTLFRKPDMPTREANWAPFADLKELKYGTKGVKWIASGTINGRAVTAIEHRYTISTGQSTQQIVHVCIASPCPKHWPRVELRGEHLLHRLADVLGATELKLESEVFNRRWRISSDDEDHAIMLLTPEVQNLLENSPSGEAWVIGPGWIRLVGKGKVLKPEGIREALQKPGRLLEKVPPELFVPVTPNEPQA
jgi:hypothetical protein